MPLPISKLSKQPFEIYDVELQIIAFLEKHKGEAFTSKEVFDSLQPEIKLLKSLNFLLFCFNLTLMFQKGLIGVGYYGKDLYVYIE